MYLQHWGLTESPFHHPPEAPWYFQGPSQEEALARLQFLVEYRHPLGLIVGDPGCGKTMLFSVFSERLRQAGRFGLTLSMEYADAHEFWWKLAAGLQLNPGVHEPSFRLWRKICDRLAQYRSVRRDLVLMLDDCDTAQTSTLEALVRLLAVNRWPEARVTALVAGTRTGLTGLSQRLLQMAELRVELETFSAADSTAYLQHCLARAGRTDNVFSNAAITRLHELSQGIPRRLSHLAELCLVAAAAQHMACVDTETVEGAFQELGVPELRQHVA